MITIPATTGVAHESASNSRVGTMFDRLEEKRFVIEYFNLQADISPFRLMPMQRWRFLHVETSFQILTRSLKW